MRSRARPARGQGVTNSDPWGLLSAVLNPELDREHPQSPCLNCGALLDNANTSAALTPAEYRAVPAPIREQIEAAQAVLRARSAPRKAPPAVPDYQVEFRCAPYWACEIITARDQLHAVGHAWRNVKAKRGAHFDRTTTTVTVVPLGKRTGRKAEKKR